MRTTLLSVILCCVLGVADCSKPTQNTGNPIATPASNYQLRSKLDLGSNVVAHLATKTATDKTQSIVVLFDQGGIASEPYPLPESAPVGDLHEETGKVTVGDPLNHESPGVVLVSGEGERAVTSWLRPIKLKAGPMCVLVEQQYGFEWIEHNHTVVCLEKGKAAKEWSLPEPPDPGVSSVQINDINGDGSDELISYVGFRAPEGPERFDVSAWKWAGSGFQEIQIPLYQVVAKSFKSAEAARTARTSITQENPACGIFWVLASSKGQVQLATKTAQDPKTLPLWKDWQKCYSTLTASKSN